MKTPETGTKRLRGFAHQLNRHETAISQNPDGHGDRGLYLGFGRIIHSNGVPYDVVTKEGEGSLQIGIYCPYHSDLLRQFGQITLEPSLRASNVVVRGYLGENHPYDTSLLRPFGRWLVDAVDEVSRKEQVKAESFQDMINCTHAFDSFVHASHPGMTEVKILGEGLEKAAGALLSSMLYHQNKGPVLSSPSVKDIDGLYELVSTSDGYSLFQKWQSDVPAKSFVPIRLPGSFLGTVE